MQVVAGEIIEIRRCGKIRSRGDAQHELVLALLRYVEDERNVGPLERRSVENGVPAAFQHMEVNEVESKLIQLAAVQRFDLTVRIFLVAIELELVPEDAGYLACVIICLPTGAVAEGNGI